MGSSRYLGSLAPCLLVSNSRFGKLPGCVLGLVALENEQARDELSIIRGTVIEE